MYSFFRELLVNSQDNLIMAAADIDVTFDFAIYFCSPKYNRKIERSKNLPKCFSLMVTFYIRGSNFMLFLSQILLLLAKYFIVDRHFLKTSFCSS